MTAAAGESYASGGCSPQTRDVGLDLDPAPWSLIADPVWVFDLQRSRIVWANPAALAFWRASDLSELSGRDFASSSEITKGRLRAYADRFALGERVDATWRFTPGGHEVTASCRCCGVPLSDGRTAMMVHLVELEESGGRRGASADAAEALRTARDQLAQAEARFRTFAEVGSDWLWETDSEHRFTYQSGSFSEHFGYPLRQALGITRHELVAAVGADPDDEATREKWARHAEDLAAHRPFRNFRFAFHHSSGEIGCAAISGDPIFDADGRFCGYRGIGHDVTKVVTAEARERELQRERDVAVAANTVMNQFLAIMSHELRTPLNAIIGFSDMLSNELLGPLGNVNYRSYAKDIHGSARHLLSIIDDLLNLSRLDVVGTEPHREVAPARALADEVLTMISVQAAGRKLSVRGESSSENLALNVDQRAMKQVLLNLLSNAVKFTEPGGSITLAIAPLDDGGVQISVCDTGHGIGDEHLVEVFEPFRSFNPLVRASDAGSGLGLWISRRIVEAHGGEIAIRSVLGKGTTVAVNLPPDCVATAEPG